MKLVHAAVLVAVMTGPAHAVTERTVKTDSLACHPERQFDRAERMRTAGDAKALQAFTNGALLSGTCVRLKTGAKVFAEGRGKGSGTIRIRPKGSVVTFFTSEANFE